MDLLKQILIESWHVLTLSAPLMLFGFLVAGLLSRGRVKERRRLF